MIQSGRLHARLDQQAPPLALGQIVVIFPEARSTEAQDAYDVACLAGMITQETGKVVEICDGSGITVIETRERGDGPA